MTYPVHGTDRFVSSLAGETGGYPLISPGCVSVFRFDCGPCRASAQAERLQQQLSKMESGMGGMQEPLSHCDAWTHSYARQKSRGGGWQSLSLSIKAAVNQTEHRFRDVSSPSAIQHQRFGDSLAPLAARSCCWSNSSWRPQMASVDHH